MILVLRIVREQWWNSRPSSKPSSIEQLPTIIFILLTFMIFLILFYFIFFWLDVSLEYFLCIWLAPLLFFFFWVVPFRFLIKFYYLKKIKRNSTWDNLCVLYSFCLPTLVYLCKLYNAYIPMWLCLMLEKTMLASGS